MEMLASVFKSLPQRVLWKFNLDVLPVEMPANVRLTKWAPQQDLLGAPILFYFKTIRENALPSLRVISILDTKTKYSYESITNTFNLSHQI